MSQSSFDHLADQFVRKMLHLLTALVLGAALKSRFAVFGSVCVGQESIEPRCVKTKAFKSLKQRKLLLKEAQKFRDVIISKAVATACTCVETNFHTNWLSTSRQQISDVYLLFNSREKKLSRAASRHSIPDLLCAASASSELTSRGWWRFSTSQMVPQRFFVAGLWFLVGTSLLVSLK